MVSLAILYCSTHHRNTELVAKKISFALGAPTFDLLEEPNIDISKYNRLILASGIYFNKLHPKLLEWIKANDLSNKEILILYTAGSRYFFAKCSLKRIFKGKKVKLMGIIHSKGYDTYGILNKIGGIAKGHPSSSDIEKMIAESIMIFDK